MLVGTKAIILHTTKFKENSLIIHAYTAEFGRTSFISNSVKSKKSSARSSMFQPCSILELQVYHQANKELHRIKEASLGYSFMDIPYHPIKNAICLFLAELLYKVLKEPHTDTRLYDFIENAIIYYDKAQTGTANFHLLFISKFTQFLGFFPHLETYCPNTYFDMANGVFKTSPSSDTEFLSPAESKALFDLCSSNFDSMDSINLNREQRRILLKHLLKYFELHHHEISKLKSLEVLQQLFD